MRLYYTFLLLLLLSVTATAQTTVFDFEGDAPTYSDFNGSVTTIIDNPDMTEPNTSAKVAQNVVPPSAEFAGLIFTKAVDFANGKTFTMQVWSPLADVPVLLKFEGGSGPNLERAVNLTGAANSWQELTFSFEAEGDFSYPSVVIFMNFNVVGSEELTFYWDNLVQIEVAPPEGSQMDLPLTFDDPTVNYGLVAFEGGVSAIVADPTDATNQVGQATKTPDSGTSAGTTVTSLPGGPLGFASRIPFTATETTMSVRIWSPVAGIPVRLKVEKGDDPTISVETQTMTTVAAAWDTLVFDFAVEATGTAALNLGSFYNKASIFFGFGSVPGAETNYYFDDMVFGGGDGGDDDGDGDGDSQMDLPVTFEEEGIDYGVVDFGGNESMIVADPEDATNTVVQSTKTAGAMTWGGTTLTSSVPSAPAGFVSQIPFTADATKMSVRVWSPTAGTPILLKVESKDDPTISVETLTNTTVAGGWDVLVFDFSTEAPGTAALDLGRVYDKASVFFNFGTMPTEAATYYWDDVFFVDGPGGDDSQMDLPVTFEEEGIDYGVVDFGGNESMIVADPEDATNTVVQSTKTAGAMTWGGTTLTSSVPDAPAGFVSQIPFAADATKMSVRVWSPTAGTPILLKVESKDDPTISVETLTNTTVAGGWDVLVFDFSTEAPGTAALDIGRVYDKASVFFNFGTMPTEAATYYWDDVFFGDVVGTNEPLTGLLEVFPNPVGNEFSIIAPERMESLILFSANGRKMGEWQPMAERFTLEASHLAPGMYVALVRTERGLMTIKLMKK
ncbi:MAG: hypothetical protein ACJATN_001716 [Neolewinella sp.]|jgi:hypothetical protein